MVWEKKALIFEHNKLVRSSHGMRGCNILRLMYNNITSRPQDISLKFYIQFKIGKYDLSNYIQNCLVLSKNHKEF
jgi:hypothetical protein